MNRTFQRTSIGLLMLCPFIATLAAQTLDVVHRFQTDGGAYGRLIQATDGNFYGTTNLGGANGVGTIFKMSASGTLTTLHSFGYTEGANPKAALLQGADGNFYGTASAGGASNAGTVFKVNPVGDVTLLHSFNGTDGSVPWAPLIQTADGNFYGTTHNGGATAHGTVFKMDSAGTLTSLHSFETLSNGYPFAALIQAADGNFYGTTAGFGCIGLGCIGLGTVFKMDAAGNVTTVHSFVSSSGANPHGSVVQDADGSLYGTTLSHTTPHPPFPPVTTHGTVLKIELIPPVTTHGTVFKIDSSGTFSVLHTFTTGEGTSSSGGLILASDGSFYGTTTGGTGHIFRVTSGGFENLHTFTTPEGSNPYSGLLQASDGNFFGTTLLGGVGGVGTVFKMDSSDSLITLSSFPTEGISPQTSLIQTPDGKFYGTTWTGGAGGVGTIFKTDSTGNITTLHSFNTADGAHPAGALIRAADGKFYGTTQQGGGAGSYGTAFKMDSAGTLTTLHSFNLVDGSYPPAGLIQLADGNFYGTTQQGGVSGFGTVFKMDPLGTVTTLHSFDNTDGAYPVAPLILGAGGNLFGTTSGDGATTWGTAFKITSAGVFTPLHSFNQSDGASPSAALIQIADGTFYGTTSGPGAEGHGTVFKMDSTGNVTTLHSFNGSDGDSPSSALIHTSDGNFYGTTYLGGTSNSGTLFKMDSSGNLTTLHSFNIADGSNIYSSLVLAADGTFWGATSTGGLGAGTVFRLILAAASLDVTSISPTSGSSSGGIPVAIAGTGFGAGARVMIGESPANAVSGGNTNAVSALAPSLSPGTLNDVTVINVNASFGTGTNLWFADFLDVPGSDSFHDYVEKIFRHGITVGIGEGLYGRDDSATRGQMAVFLLKSQHGSSHVPPACHGIFQDVPCTPGGGFADWIEELFQEGVTGGCSTDPLQYCPDRAVRRDEMAALLLKAEHGSAYVPPACHGIFQDVPCTPGAGFADWIERLYSEGITSGCLAAPLSYCPDRPSSRGEMAVFLVRTFNLQLD